VFDPLPEVLLLFVGFVLFSVFEAALVGLGLGYWAALLVAMMPFVAAGLALRWRRARFRCYRCHVFLPYAKARVAGASHDS
jgi:hypothetical protein